MKFVYTPHFQRQIKKLQKSDKKLVLRVKKYLEDIEKSQDPRSRGKSLVGDLSGIWRYRIGDYRVFCKIVDDDFVIYALEIGHRKEVYK